MRIEPVEIYSDAINAPVMRHPGRKFPGCLLQGDTLHGIVTSLATVQRELQRSPESAAEELGYVVDQLQGYLNHYSSVLAAHGIALPFSASPFE